MTDTPPVEPPVAPKLVLAKPPKPIKSMTDEELREWARGVGKVMEAQRPAVEAVREYRRRATKAP